MAKKKTEKKVTFLRPVKPPVVAVKPASRKLENTNMKTTVGELRAILNSLGPEFDSFRFRTENGFYLKGIQLPIEIHGDLPVSREENEAIQKEYEEKMLAYKANLLNELKEVTSEEII